ncbi:hypothetical protein CCACVL1_26349 [Corchorus capsularis]|uniref:Uncharacterized protein n=1 Tax=Corchorus capsularis TaxID=210143 RepID=A0A1R3GF24_COCAP|nr:hypothetical protein CCACVL1_26349 [Corchorus capsularis]
MGPNKAANGVCVGKGQQIQEGW